MKKIMAMVLALVMLSGMPLSLAEETEAPAAGGYEELVVGSTTRLTGGFFTEMWGNNTSDVDVRMLLHGYGLIRWDGETGVYAADPTVVSGLAVVEDSYGNRTYNIALNPDLKYSDGTAITAYDYAFSILLGMAPEVAAIGGAVNDSDAIYGSASYKLGETEILSGVRVVNEYLLQVTVKAEYLPFFYELALLNYNPYPIHVIAPGCEVADDGEGVYIRSTSGEGDAFTAELLAETILNPETGYRSHPTVVSGPYKMVSYDGETGVAEFVINEYYKGNTEGETPEIERIIVRPVSNETMMNELAAGEVDLLNKCVNAEALMAGMQLVTSGAVSVSNYARSGYSFVSFSCEQPATGSAAVRQAIAHCFDKDLFVSDYVRNFGLRVDGYYGIGQWMYQLTAGTLGAPVEELAADATAEEIAAREAELAEWEALSLENVPVYELSVEAAVELLEADGWTLNRAGEAYDAESDDVRCKEIDGERVALELSLIYPEGNAAGEYLTTGFAENLAQAGIILRAEAKPFEELLREYYRQTESRSDMIYLATNFAYVFEPSETFSVEDAYQGENNRTGIVDEELYRLAVEMRQTEPGNVLEYCQKWVAFQEYWSEVLPTIPVYSNVYFDFYTPLLQNYTISADVSWAEAIVGAYLSDAMETEIAMEEEEFEFID